MDSNLTPFEYGRTHGRYALAFALGLVLMGYSGMTYWQAAYMAVNPAVGDVSTSTAGVLFHVGLFLVGATLVFASGVSSLYKVLEDTDI